MTDEKIIAESLKIFEKEGIQYIIDHGFIDTMKLKIAMINRSFYQYVGSGLSVVQSITNCAIDFSVSEGTVKRYVYEYRAVKF